MTLTVAELFAGVGGFRLGLEGLPSGDEKGPFQVIWANQWEPGIKRQHAAEIYAHHWNLKEQDHDCEIFSNGEGELLVNKNIEFVPSSDIPSHDLLCGGFPCQDYSVARTRSGEMGIEGKKGKLWTSIRRIIKEASSKPSIVFLENVPRLLNSPAVQRGLNFTVILKDLLELGYDAEWRVINAADYGFPQKRKRVFIVAYLREAIAVPTSYAFTSDEVCKSVNQWIGGSEDSSKSENKIVKGPISRVFLVNKNKHELIKMISLDSNKRNISPYKNTGYAWKDVEGNLCMVSVKTSASYSGVSKRLEDVIETPHDPDYEITDEEKLRKYRYIKGEQKEWRIRKADKLIADSIDAGNGLTLWTYYQTLTRSYATGPWTESRENRGYLAGVEKGIIYNYTAGKMAFPDSLLNPSRTVVTAEVGKSVSRMRHVIEYEAGKFRRLMPIELERLNGFPSNWTNLGGVSDSRRGFLMGNALVVGVVKRLSGPLAELIRDGVNNDA
jgi:DNA (cytosine-5)-methyltransferase 1